MNPLKISYIYKDSRIFFYISGLSIVSFLEFICLFLKANHNPRIFFFHWDVDLSAFFGNHLAEVFANINATIKASKHQRKPLPNGQHPKVEHLWKLYKHLLDVLPLCLTAGASTRERATFPFDGKAFSLKHQHINLLESFSDQTETKLESILEKVAKNIFSGMNEFPGGKVLTRSSSNKSLMPSW